MFAKITQALIASTQAQTADLTLVDTVFPGLDCACATPAPRHGSSAIG
jgi:hypothetical protein